MKQLNKSCCYTKRSKSFCSVPNHVNHCWSSLAFCIILRDITMKTCSVPMPAFTPLCRWLTSAVELKDLSSQEGIYIAAERSLVWLKSEIYPPHPLSLSALSKKEVGQHLTFSGVWLSSSSHPLDLLKLFGSAFGWELQSLFPLPTGAGTFGQLRKNKGSALSWIIWGLWEAIGWVPFIGYQIE